MSGCHTFQSGSAAEGHCLILSDMAVNVFDSCIFSIQKYITIIGKQNPLLENG
jgi:hypothetical protein